MACACRQVDGGHGVAEIEVIPGDPPQPRRRASEIPFMRRFSEKIAIEGIHIRFRLALFLWN